MPKSGAVRASDLDVVVVGAGFAGLYLLHRLRGLGLRTRVLEAGSGVGGTWYWNRYPGARCDIESMQYSYQFDDALQQDWEWSERYAAQPEILTYANHVADRFGLRSDIQFDTRVSAASFDETAGRWTVETETGARLTACYLILATGCLSVPNWPDVPGLERFQGPVHHTGLWPHGDVDFTGQRVAVIGTGSSAVQSIPQIAKQAAQLTVFQRTPNYAVPAQNRPLDPEVVQAVKADYGSLRARAAQTFPIIDARWNTASAMEVGAEERVREYEARWQDGGLPFYGAFSDLASDKVANETAAEFIRGKIRQIVQDPEVAERLCPHNFFGGKRLCVEIDYFETYNRSNVTLVDINETPIETVTETGLRTQGGDLEVDSIVCATGFDAMTGAVLKIDLRGRGGASLREAWAQGPQTYLGLAIEGFPNLFTVTGPTSPSVFTNMLPAIEQHVNWITDCLQHLRDRGLSLVEATPQAQAAWMAHHEEVARPTIRAQSDSWYTGANIAGKPRTLMPYIGGFPAYASKCAEVAARGYDGFAMS